MINHHQPFHQKYRPTNFDELIGQEVISLTLRQALITNKIAPAYLFSGPRGTGKTSSARILAKSLNCLIHKGPNALPCNKCELCKNINNGIALDIIEIDAASNTGVENIREIIERANFAPTQARWKVYVIDECHMLSTAASNALLKTIEEPPERVVFILATTNPERVLNTIQSRCQKFDFKRINSDDIYKHLLDIANKEEIKFEDEGIKLISKRANGGMRDAQRLLDQLSLIPNGITKKDVEVILGEVPEKDLISLINSLIFNIPESLIEECANLYDAGNEPISILEGLLNITRDLLLKTVTNNYSDLFYTSKEFQPELDKISKLIQKSKIIDWHQQLKNLEYQIKNSSQPRLWLEINLTSLLEIKTETESSTSDLKINKNNNTKSSNQRELKKDVQNTITNNNLEIEANNSESSHKNNNNDDESINLKEKWSLILSKLELPSTRMLLSQQAELLGIQSNFIEIGLSPNWENMIKSRKVVIEDAVKKIFGDHMSINFTSKKDLKNSLNSKVQNTDRNDSFKDSQTNSLGESKIISENIENPVKKNNLNLEDTTKLEQNSSKNLAEFFNGQIIETKE